MYDMLAMVILMLLASIFAGSIESDLMEAFKAPEWMDIKEWEERR